MLQNDDLKVKMSHSFASIFLASNKDIAVCELCFHKLVMYLVEENCNCHT